MNKNGWRLVAAIVFIWAICLGVGIYKFRTLLKVQSANLAMHELMQPDPKFFLDAVDEDLRNVEEDKEHPTVGDLFDLITLLREARLQGASLEEINERLDRTRDLAKKGKYLSPYLKKVAEEGELDRLFFNVKRIFTDPPPPPLLSRHSAGSAKVL